MILNEAEARAIIAKILSYTTADEMRVNLAGWRSGNTRFALNTVTTSGDQEDLSISITAFFGKKKGAASINEIDDAALKRAVKMAEDIARVAPEDPEYVPELASQQYLNVDPYFESTAAASPDLRARAAEAAIDPAMKKQLVAAGFSDHSHGFSAVGNNKGLWGYYRNSNASYSVTVRSTEGAASGWDSVDSRRIEDVDYRGSSGRAIRKAEESRDAKRLDPGVYPVILEPQAVAELMSFAFFSLDARSADEGRSFFSKPGGKNKIGEKIAGSNITVRSDPTHPDLLGEPFGWEGLPAKKITWIEKGVLKQLFYSRYWAQKQGKEPTGFPGSVVFEGGKGSLEDLIKDTDKAVLITRFWYTNFVDPETMLVTGLTRDGTFWVEKGRIKHAVRNFRFNDSPLVVLNKVTGMSRSVRTGGSLVPAIRASAFTFSSISDAV